MTGQLREYRATDEARARTIYEDSFPPSLRAPWTELVAHRADEQLCVLVDDGDSAVGIALIRQLGDTGMTFVRYLAVDPSQRSAGLGTRLVALLRRELRDRGVTVLLLDVEAPLGEHAEDDRRRIAFYERCGLTLLDVPDYAPPDHGGTGETVPLLLMGQVLDGGGPLVGGRLQDVVRAVLRYRYHLPP